MLLFVATIAFVAGWRYAAHKICPSCNRIGNYLDDWYRRELMCAVDGCTPVSDVRTDWWQFVAVESALPPHANMSARAAMIDTRVFGWTRGVVLRNFFHFRSPRAAFSTTAYPARAAVLPPPPFWSTEAGKVLLKERGECCSYFWGSDAFVQLLPFLRPSLRALVDSHEKSTWRSEPEALYETSDLPEEAWRWKNATWRRRLSRSRSAGPKAAGDATAGEPRRTCVLHYRIGESLWLPSADEREAVADSLVGAIRSFGRPPQRVHVLNGGARHACEVSDTKACGLDFLGFLVARMRTQLTNVTFVMVHGSPDEDFVRASRADCLVVGAGSFAHMAAAASHGEVRSPACMQLPYDTRRCIHHVADGWSTYMHPRCKCSTTSVLRRVRGASTDPHSGASTSGVNGSSLRL